MLKTILFAVVAIGCAAAHATLANAKEKPHASGQTVDLHQHPTENRSPIEVSIGLYVTNIVAIDETRESFEIGGYLVAQWRDPRLAIKPAASATPEHGVVRQFEREDIWGPHIEAANSISHRTNSFVREADENGVVTDIERFDGVLSTGFALRKFPFDSQQLELKFQPFLSSSSGIEFAPTPLSLSGIGPQQHTELAAWQVRGIHYSLVPLEGRGIIPGATEAIFQIEVARRVGFYIWKVFLPLIILALIPWVPFWLDVKDYDWQSRVPLSILIAMVAFELTISRDLPRIGYITFLDAVFLASFLFVFLSIVVIHAIYRLRMNHRPEKAAKLHVLARWTYPGAYLGVLMLFVIGFFV